AGKAQVDEIHKKEGVYPVAKGSVCPYASAAAAAEKTAETILAARKAGCPAHAHIATDAPVAKVPEVKQAVAAHKLMTNAFDYEGFYSAELEKKHKDKSYRYFNNINRLAAKFPVAHTASHGEEVHVWCSNDYLGMSKNPVVLET